MTLTSFYNRLHLNFYYGIGLLLLTCIGLPASAQRFINPHFSRFTINNGLSQSLVYAITQDREGFMWFGTKDGLNRFDGYNFKIYYHDPFDSTSLSDNAVTSLFTDSNGRIWIGTLKGGLDLYDQNKDIFHHFLSHKNNGYSIRVITEDHAGHLWVGTYGNGLYELIFNQKNNHKPKKIIHYAHQPGNPLSLNSNFIFDVYADHRGKLWVSSETNIFQFGVLNAKEVQFHTPEFTTEDVHRKIIPDGIQFNPKKTTTSKGGNFNFTEVFFVEDNLKRLWIGTPSGLFLFEQNNNKLLFFNPLMPGLQQSRIQSICKVSPGNIVKGSSLWLGFYGGLGIFNPSTFALQLIKNSLGNNEGPFPDNSQSLLSVNILSIYQDRSGCVWLGSNGYGLSKFDTRSTLFPLPEYHIADGSISTENLSIRSFFDMQHYLFIGATDGLWQADKKTRVMHKIRLTKNPPIANLVFSIVPADSDNVWLAGNLGLYRYDPHNGRVRRYLPLISGNGQTDNRIFKLYNDENGHIWCLTAYTFSIFNIAQKTFTHYFYNHKKINEFSEPAYGDIYQQDPKGNFWLGTGEGLLYFDTSAKTFQRYTTNPSDPFSLSFNAVRCILPDPKHPDKYLWIGTAGGGLNKFDLYTKKFTHFTVKNGLPNNVVYGILPDSQDRLWMSTNKGISRFDPVTGNFHNYNVLSGLQSNEFNSGAFYENKQGKLFFGGIAGFNAFYPGKIQSNMYAPPVVFTEFRLSNHRVTIKDQDSPLKNPISETHEISLSYKNNNISFQVAGLDYSNPDKIQYAYKLDPLNTDWINIGNNRLITFTGLAPGHYTLHVKAANSDGVWNKKGAGLQLIIIPPWWKTWWAYLLYILILLTALFYFRRYDLKRIRLQNSLQIKNIEAQKLKELDSLKSRFFANISHEFRTPLTLIQGPVEDLLKGGDSDQFKKVLPEVHRNSKRLLQLVNQLLDLSKLDTNSYQINTTREDIIPFVRQLVYSFTSMANRRRIRLEMETDPKLREGLLDENKRFYFDEDMIEKIVSNLLSNAFKFTPEGGAIDVSIGLSKKKKGFLELMVKDTGIGIPAEKLIHIFDRFYQADDSGKRRYEGSGVGLALLKELVDLLQGDIAVESEPDEGTTFYCYLPFNKKIISKELPAEDRPIKNPVSEIILTEEDTIADQEIPNDKCHVLIVEDHQDVRTYIREKLEDTYAVTEAKNGKDGLELALKHIPDMIISDVMMPEMDGFELCKQLKTDNLTSHIPVILLTARAEDSDKMAGLETGADAYLIKPFNSQELRIRVRKLIEIRNKMRTKFSDKLIVKPGEITTNSIDRQFMQKLLSIVEDHISDSMFSVDHLAEKMNMSYLQIYRKLKALINQSAQQFIQSVRMQRALELLKNDSATVSEVSWKVGFENPGYFTKVFKKHFGCAPSEREKFPD